MTSERTTVLQTDSTIVSILCKSDKIMLISAMNMRCYRLKSASNAFSTIRLIVPFITLLYPLAFLISSCNYNSYLCK